MTSRRLFLSALFSFSFAAPAALVRAEDGFITEEIKPAKKAQKKPVKKKGYDYERSKYKSQAPASGSTYKFNEKGEPIVPGAKKKAAPAKKKRSEPPEAGLAESGEVCGLEESCVEKKTEADSL
ncbi:MAG: hypothetical protein Q8T11_14005 [Elusimicrobiota bacterium]|nr:hypothetical protein [Elusimicrobiota bacterium]